MAQSSLLLVILKYSSRRQSLTSTPVSMVWLKYIFSYDSRINRCADRSFVSTTFSPLIDITLTTLDTKYAVELADGKIIGADTIIQVWSLEWAKENAKKGSTPKCHPADKVKERSDGKEAEVLKNHSPVTSLKVDDMRKYSCAHVKRKNILDFLMGGWISRITVRPESSWENSACCACRLYVRGYSNYGMDYEVLMMDWSSIVETDKVIHTVETDVVKLVVKIKSFGMSFDKFNEQTGSSDGRI
uniref:Uncharacterized protein n=1 Tax=Tanacetum cinerariifolium TaxID=118510 RepID=A0A6L2P685_TANCI|nr:hypothetical protein [Tanacetum cinerariifolium]